jgi:hypothetical protein
VSRGCLVTESFVCRDTSETREALPLGTAVQTGTAGGCQVPSPLGHDMDFGIERNPLPIRKRHEDGVLELLADVFRVDDRV